MARYLLDTTALIDFSRGHVPTRDRLLALIDAGDDLGVCSANVAEFFSGVPPEKRETFLTFFAALSYWEPSREAAAQAGFDRYQFARQGLTLSMTDALIAATAREQDATLISNNVKDYPMRDITVVSITKEGELR